MVDGVPIGRAKPPWFIFCDRLALASAPTSCSEPKGSLWDHRAKTKKKIEDRTKMPTWEEMVHFDESGIVKKALDLINARRTNYRKLEYTTSRDYCVTYCAVDNFQRCVSSSNNFNFKKVISQSEFFRYITQ